MSATRRPRTAPSPPQKRAGAEITEHRLKNGLRVLILERHTDPVVAVMTWYAVGSRNEEPREAGVSHFLEHMMFKGSARFGKGEVDRLTTVLGGSNNAFTTPDHTAYWFELASDRWEVALEIEAERMQGLLLDPAEFDAERAVVLEELSMGLDDPWRTLSRQVQEMLFPRHPYGRPVIGYADALQALEPQDMRDYYERFYHPGNAVVLISGDVEPKRALRSVKAHFGGLSAGPSYAEADCYRPRLEDLVPQGERRVVTTWDDPASRLCIAWPTISVGTDDDYALDLASAVLTGGRLARLHRKLVLEQGLATSIATTNDTRRDGGAFWLFAEGVEGVEPERLERAIDAEFDALAARAVPSTELNRAKRTLDASEACDGETVSDLAEDVGGYAIDCDWRLALQGVERRARVRGTTLRDVVRRYLSRERRVLGWSLPAGGAR